MRNNKIVKFIFGIVAVFVIVLVLVNLAGNPKSKQTSEFTSYSEKDIAGKITFLKDKINITEATPRKASVELTTASLYDELPEIEKYPLVVEGTGDIVLEIFVSPEKAGSGKDGWLIEAAKEFNAQKFKVGKKTASVSIRNVSSGQGADYIISGKYLPDAYTPSSRLWGDLIKAQGGNVTVEVDRMVGNVAGILVSKTTKNKLETAYGKADLEAVIKAVVNNEIVMGYTNPLSSSTGLNFLLSTLNYYDQDQLLSEKAKAGFTSFQNNIPFVAYTTIQMRDSASSGKLEGMINEYQLYVNDEELSKYEFIPFGIRHDNPLYSVGNLSEGKQAALDGFVKFCQESKMQKLAAEYGFNGMDEYKGDSYDTSGGTIVQAQKLWKENKDGGKDIIAVFVADTSGSMDGDPLLQLKKSLINGAQYINDNNSIGLVSYSSDVTIEVPVAKFDLNQRAYFQGAVEDLQAVGGTASYDGVAVGISMLLEAKQKSPNAKLMLFLLSDGATNEGNTMEYVSPLIKESGIPIYTIGYNADIEALQTISEINEASSINADSDDVIYKIKSLFNAQM
ncbi:VWA domain-containing protein [Anaerocolumna cellulosilytica]|uniref:VWA domain-containing protein n=1 Tax=Anaerocolumna cellulosilytica TaxID=433286 RepID=A0A6S6R2R3_9FIRM|nr:VWA domain-containing protein [Anaerocolumna cellulosilytica]MBB5196085.1 Ca-activated chloride channel family protein [Anaerocolumna cellulosilytica]BCJ93610.1 VWA domain-containing protein [Anaerocolumna cellulosilytica]